MKTNPKSVGNILKMAFAVLIALFSSTSFFAQSNFATVRGTVSDPNGALIAGAKVTISNDVKAYKRDVVTDEDGNFTFPQLPPETYKLTIERKGFANTEVPNIQLNANDQRRLNVEMKLSDVVASIIVEGGSQGVETGGASSTTVSGQLVERLPLNGRSFQALLYQVPGVVPAAGDGQISVNGNRTDGNYFTLDGVSANIGVAPRLTAVATLGAPFGAQGVADQKGVGSVAGFNASGSTTNLISVDALQEFKIQTSTYSAEFGRQPGGQIQMTSKSGGNDYHFTAFEYFRNDALDANDWFSNRSGLTRSPLKQNDFGGTLGGPVYLPRFGEGGPFLYNGKNRTFFFASFEALRLKQPIPASIQNVPAKYVRDSAALFNPTIQSLLNAYPLPNGAIACSTTGAALPTGFVNPCPTGQNPTTTFQTFTKNNYTLQDTTAWSVRIDHKISSKWDAFGRVSISPSDSKSPAVGKITINEVNTKTATFGLIGMFSPSLVNDLRFNWSRNESNSYINPYNEDGANPPTISSLLPNIAPAGSFVSVSLPGTNVIYQLGIFAENRQRQLNLVDTMTWIKGSHSFKFGFDYRRLNPEYAPREYALTASLTTLDRLVSGTGSVSIASADRVPLKVENFSFFGQDSWRIGKRLTLDYGVRWDINPAPVGTDKPLYSLTGLGDLTQLGRVNAPPSTTQLTTGKLYPTKFGAVAPRFGLAYNLVQKNGWESVVRGGFGIYYDLGAGIAANAASQYPYSRSRSVGTVAFPLSDANGTPAAPLSVTPPIPSSQNFTVIDPEFSLPRSYQWTAAYSQNFLKNYNLTVTYVGNQGRLLLRRYLTQLSTSATVNPNFRSATLNISTNKSGNADTSDYHAMQVQFNRRFANSWQFLSNYSWSHAIDTGSDDAAVNYFGNGGNPQVDRGNSNFDRRHIFNLALSYETAFKFNSKLAKGLVNGWTMDVVFKAQSAAPFSVIYSRSIPSLGTGNTSTFPFRASVVAGQDPWIIDATAPGGKRLNPAAFLVGSAAFATPASLNDTTQGTSLRNGYYGFGATQLDFAMGRQFSLTEKLKLSLKAEAFNIFNHPNFGNPSGNLGNYTTNGTTVTYSPADACITNSATACTTFGRSTTMLNRSFGTSSGAFSSLYQLGGPRSMQLSAKFIF